MNHLPENSNDRKAAPMAEGLLDYFPDALAYVAYVSKVGNDKHNPGEPMHHSRGKSTDHADCIMRHLVDRGGVDSAGVLHSGALAWRSLALLQEELEQAKLLADPDLKPEDVMPRGARFDPPPTAQPGELQTRKSEKRHTFIIWEGGERPVPQGTGISYSLRHRPDDFMFTAYPERLRWMHDGTASDVVRYRVLSRQELI